MKKVWILMLVLCLVASVFGGCTKETEEKEEKVSGAAKDDIEVSIDI